jgi:hypothetical protein
VMMAPIMMTMRVTMITMKMATTYNVDENEDKNRKINTQNRRLLLVLVTTRIA